MPRLWGEGIEEKEAGQRGLTRHIYDHQPVEAGWECYPRFYMGYYTVWHGPSGSEITMFAVDENDDIIATPSEGDRQFLYSKVPSYLTWLDKRRSIVSISAKYRTGRVGPPSGVIYVNGKRVAIGESISSEGVMRVEPQHEPRVYTEPEKQVMDRLREMYNKMNKG
jgi:hypothetical protein